MSGLVAIVANLPHTAVAEDEIQALAAAYEATRGGANRLGASAGSRARAIVFDPPWRSSPGIRSEDGPTGTSWVAFTGVPHGRASLVGTPPEDLDGQFALVSFDAHANHLLVATDPFGMHALYTAERDGRTYVSTSALALARHLKASPSPYRLSFFLRSGYHFAPMSNWEGIDRMEPGTCARFTDRGPERAVYWRPRQDPKVLSLPFDRAVEHCLDVAVETFRAYWGHSDGVWTDLTGGFDSRLLNLLMAKAGVEFMANTRAEEADDVALATRVARMARWPAELISMPEDWPDQLPALLEGALGWADGNLEVLELAWVIHAHDFLAARRPSLLSAGGGEHFQYTAWKTQPISAGRKRTPKLDTLIVMFVLRQPPAPGLLADDHTQQIRDELATRLRTWAEPYKEERATTQLDVMYAYRSTGHFGQYHSADYACLAAELPFYTKPVFAAAFSTNHRHRNQHRLMRHMIARLNPRVAGIPTSHGGPAEPWRLTNLHRFAPYYGEIGRKAISKLAAKGGRRLLPTVHRFDPASLPARRAVLRTVFGEKPARFEDLRSGPLFRPREVEDFLARASREERFDTTTLGRLLTVELLLRETDAHL